MSVSSNPIRFGLNPRGMSFERTVEIARLAESAGFEIVSFSDRPPETNLEGWTMATAVAMRTERIRVTHSTLNVPYRYPALLAKMASALDVITGGDRLLMTLGAGAQEAHATTYGMPWGTPGERVDGLVDTINILRGMWSTDHFSYEGKLEIVLTYGSTRAKVLSLKGVFDGIYPRYSRVQERVRKIPLRAAFESLPLASADSTAENSRL